MELLVGAVALVELDDLLGRQIQTCAPALQFDLGREQALPPLVDRALGDLHHKAQTTNVQPPAVHVCPFAYGRAGRAAGSCCA